MRTSRLLASLVLVTSLVLASNAANATATTCFGRPATIVGTNGPDRIVGTAGSDVIAGLGGKDIIAGGGGADFICGNAGDPDVLGE